MATEGPAPTVQVVQKYRQLGAECQQLMSKIAELEGERNEHKLVEDTLVPLDPGRRAFRLVGEVLVERTVGEVLPSVKTNRENVSKVTRLVGLRRTCMNIVSSRCCFSPTAAGKDNRHTAGKIDCKAARNS